MSISTGTSLGRYEIRSHLGAGGMGEVYLATDTTLDRVGRSENSAAAKSPPTSSACSASCRKRKPLRALNHPNILTIFEIGETNGAHFIATEFIDGITLRQHMAGRRLKLSEALDIAAQIAAGSVGRALPSGSSTATSSPKTSCCARTATRSSSTSGWPSRPSGRLRWWIRKRRRRCWSTPRPGMVMGTVSYMSPEQARGYQLDCADRHLEPGRRALRDGGGARALLSGETTSDVIVAVLDREPPPLPGGPHETPLELQRILRKALRKDKEERYQTVKDLLVDLRALKQEVDFEAKLETSVPPESRSLAAFNTISAQNSLRDRKRQGGAHEPRPGGALHARFRASPRAARSDERFKQWTVLALVAGFAAVITGLVYMYLHQRGRRAPPRSSR